MIQAKIKETIGNLQNLCGDGAIIQSISDVAKMIIAAIRSGNKLLICGNGGSAADAQHIAGEFLCRFYKERAPMPAIALSTDTSVLTSISNDYSYDHVFSRQVAALGKQGDVLLGISTSGSSRNVLRAFQIASDMSIKTILLTGSARKDIAPISDVVIMTPSQDTPRIQEMHLLIEHIICELVEAEVNSKSI